MPVGRKLFTFLDRLAEFGLALLRHWLAFVGGSVATAVLLVLYERFVNPVPTPYYVGILFVGVLVSAYLAWGEEYDKRQLPEHDPRPLLVFGCARGATSSESPL